MDLKLNLALGTSFILAIILKHIEQTVIVTINENIKIYKSNTGLRSIPGWHNGIEKPIKISHSNKHAYNKHHLYNSKQETFINPPFWFYN